MYCPYCYTRLAAGEGRCSRCGHVLTGTEKPAPSMTISRPYQPSGNCPRPTVPFLLGGTVAASVAAGILYFCITRVADIPLVLPMLVGLGVGTALAAIITRGRCRSARLAVACAVLAGPLTYGTRLLCDGQPLWPTAASQSTVANASVEERSLWNTLVQHASARAIIGSERGARQSRGGILSDDRLAWALLLLQTGLISLAAGAVARSAVARPFCESCDRWYTQVRVTRVNPSQRPALVDAVQARDWARIAYLPVGGAVSRRNRCDLILHHCPSCLTGMVAIVGEIRGTLQPPAYTTVDRESTEYLALLTEQGLRPSQPPS